MRSYSSSVVGISPPKTQTLDPIPGANSRGGQVPCLFNNNFLSASVPFQIPLKKISMNIKKDKIVLTTSDNYKNQLPTLA